MTICNNQKAEFKQIEKSSVIMSFQWDGSANLENYIASEKPP